METISWDDFEVVELRTGTILKSDPIEAFPANLQTPLLRNESIAR